MFLVYIIRNEIGDLYTGFTTDLDERLTAHNEGRTKSTRGHQWKLVYYEAYASEKDARMREARLKRSGKARRALRERLKASLELEWEELGAGRSCEPKPR